MEKPRKPLTDTRRIVKGWYGPKLEKARVRLRKAGRKPMGPSKIDRKIASIAMTSALDAAGFDPKKPEDREMRSGIHILSQRGIILSNGIKSAKPGTEEEARELEAKRKKLRRVTSTIVEVVERSKGEAAKKRFVRAYNKHSGVLRGLRG